MAALATAAPGPPPAVKNEAMGAQRGSPPDSRILLNTYIHNYFVEQGHHKLAESVRETLPHNHHRIKLPNRNNVNGVDDSMDGDSKDGVNGQNGELSGTFLLEWWSLFWDMWSAARERNVGPASQYMQQSQRLRNQQQNMLNQRMGGPVNIYGQQLGLRGGVGMTDAQRSAMQNSMQNSMRLNNPQLQMQQRMQQMGQNPGMQRDAAEMDVNGRPGSPSSGDNQPSPKRPRIDGGAFTGPQMAMSRVMGGPLRNNNTGVTMGMPGQDLNLMADFSANGNGMNNHMGGNNNGGALADYQLQLMLLEQQNKKRLMVARQEHDVSDTNPLGPGEQPAFGGSAMSPGHSRLGLSPNTQNQMKQNTPQIGQKSPLPDGMMAGARDSPAPGGFEGGQMPSSMAQQQLFKQTQMGGGMINTPNGNMIRPPFAMPNGAGIDQQQMEMMRQQQHQQAQAQQQQQQQQPQQQPNQGRMPGQNFPPGGPQQMMPQQVQQQQQMPPQVGQQDNMPNRGAMPPPQAPPSAANQQRTQPPSPQQAAAPPTPSQSKAANPKAKKDTKDSKKKPQKKGSAATGAAASTEAEQPPTPTPSTPNVPQKNQTPFNQPATNNNLTADQNMNGQSAPADASSHALGTMPMPQDMPTNIPNFSSMDSGPNFDLAGFSVLEENGELESFDFDAFLTDPSGQFGFDNEIG